jgi:hypothetical protein
VANTGPLDAALGRTHCAKETIDLALLSGFIPHPSHVHAALRTGSRSIYLGAAANTNIADVFAALWGCATRDLLVSFDAARLLMTCTQTSSSHAMTLNAFIQSWATANHVDKATPHWPCWKGPISIMLTLPLILETRTERIGSTSKVTRSLCCGNVTSDALVIRWCCGIADSFIVVSVRWNGEKGHPFAALYICAISLEAWRPRRSWP